MSLASTVMNDLAADLARAVSGDVRFDPYSRILYSTDASVYQIEPLGVVLPRDRDDVQAVIEIAGKYNVPVLARGGGSSLAGQAVGAAVVIDFSKHMRSIVEINAEEGWVRSQPGVVCDALNAAVKPYGLMFGAEPASSNRATVGGMISNNSTGAHSVLYRMREYGSKRTSPLTARARSAARSFITVEASDMANSFSFREILHSYIILP